MPVFRIDVKILRAVSEAIDLKDPRTYLHGVLLESCPDQESEFRAVATNGHVMFVGRGT